MEADKEKWFYSDGYQVSGPLPEKAIRNLIVKGNIAPDHFLTRSAETDWKPVKEIFPEGLWEDSSTTHSRPSNSGPCAETEAGKPPPPKFLEKFSNHVTTVAGIERLEGFSLRELFSEVFSNHSLEEVEEEFSVGSKHTTPEVV